MVGELVILPTVAAAGCELGIPATFMPFVRVVVDEAAPCIRCVAAFPLLADGKASLFLVAVASVVCCMVKGLRAIDVTSGLAIGVACFFVDVVKLIVGDE